MVARAGLKRNLFDKMIKEGKELKRYKDGRYIVVDEHEFNNWLDLKRKRTVELDKNIFITALKFALRINYAGHTRSDFGTIRQRPFMQAIENWTQGVLAELALQKYIKEKFGVELKIEFEIFDSNIVVGQDIKYVQRGQVVNPPQKNISVKSGKINARFLVVPINEVENPDRVSDVYIFVRIKYPEDLFARLYKDIPELEDLHDTIPFFSDLTGEIVGYCWREELEYRTMPELGINNQCRYLKETGLLRNSDNDWQNFVNQI